MEIIGQFSFNLPLTGTQRDWYSSFEKSDKLGWPPTDKSFWNQIPPETFELGSSVHLAIVFDGIEGRESFFINGTKKCSVEIDSSYWSGFLESIESQSADSVVIGVGTMDHPDNWHLARMDCYSLRLYSKALTDDEVKENYNSTVAYHEFLGGDIVYDN